MPTAIRNALPSPRQLVRQMGLILGVSVLVGTFLFHVWTGLDRLPDRWPRFLWNVYFTLIHAIVIVTSVRAAIRGLRIYVPLPGVTLQPLVENAVQHGVGGTRDDCTVAVEAARADDRLVLRVTDTGPGLDTTDLDVVLDEGTGLANVRERLDLFFGTAAQMRLLPQGVELRIPVQGGTEERPRTTPGRTAAE